MRLDTIIYTVCSALLLCISIPIGIEYYRPCVEYKPEDNRHCVAYDAQSQCVAYNAPYEPRYSVCIKRKKR